MATSPGTPEDRARFEVAVAKTIINEGGAKIYSDPATGEYSKYGISLKFFQGLKPQATKDDILNLTEEGAKSLYYDHFYNDPKLWRLDSDVVMGKIFDLGVNGGASTGIRLLQRAIVSLGNSIRVDGQLGPATAQAANICDPVKLLEEVKTHAAARYRLIAQTDPRHVKDLPGWMNRLESA